MYSSDAIQDDLSNKARASVRRPAPSKTRYWLRTLGLGIYILIIGGLAAFEYRLAIAMVVIAHIFMQTKLGRLEQKITDYAKRLGAIERLLSEPPPPVDEHVTQ